MAELKTLDELAEVLGDGGPFNPDQTFGTVGDLVDSLINLGNTNKVFARHDDHLGLKEGLSKAFLNVPLDEADESRFEEDIELVLEQANIIIPLSDRPLSDDDMDEIDEDRTTRGDTAND